MFLICFKAKTTGFSPLPLTLISCHYCENQTCMYFLGRLHLCWSFVRFVFFFLDQWRILGAGDLSWTPTCKFPTTMVEKGRILFPKISCHKSICFFLVMLVGSPSHFKCEDVTKFCWFWLLHTCSSEDFFQVLKTKRISWYYLLLTEILYRRAMSL